MIVKKLRFENYRNLTDNTITVSDKVNVFFGDNAQGKTNLLEALWLFCFGHSFRGSKDSEIIKFDSEFAKLSVDFFAQEREQNAQLIFAPGKKQIFINGAQKDSVSALCERFSAVIFSPEHLTLVKSGPSVRRRFIDGAITQQKTGYSQAVQKYDRIINQRNALLKDIYKHSELKDTLEIWDQSLCVTGALIISERLKYISRLSQTAKEYHLGISNSKETLDIGYVSSCSAAENDSVNDIAEKLFNAYNKSRYEDFHTGYTNVGPHRDDLSIQINGVSAKTFGSQGQQRSCVLSLKLAEARILSENNGEEPVILLDDVLSELDNKRQEFLLNGINDYQVFVTCCEKSGKEQLEKGKTFYIENGAVSPCTCT